MEPNSPYSFRRYQPLGLRIWHWLNALVILGLLATVLLRKTFLSWRANSAVIQEKLTAAGTTITPELAKDIAVAIRNPLWDWHIYLGFALAGLFVSRFLISFFIEKRCPFLHTLKSAAALKTVPQADRFEAIHYTLVRAGYAVFYFATLFMIVSGLTLTFKADLGISKDLSDTTKELHELAMWFFVVFVAGHIGGVIISETTKNPGLVSDMINGGERKK